MSDRDALFRALANKEDMTRLVRMTGKTKVAAIRDWQGRTILHKAAEKNQDKELSDLLAFNFSDLLDVADSYGNTAIARASQVGSIQCVLLLIGGGASLEAANLDGDVPLTIAAAHPDSQISKEMVVALLEAGADALKTDAKGFSARQLTSHDSVRLLLEDAENKANAPAACEVEDATEAEETEHLLENGSVLPSKDCDGDYFCKENTCKENKRRVNLRRLLLIGSVVMLGGALLALRR